ncbi:hypothetical protein [Clostridium tertium]|uniref:hypothetical protein n=1 Tax=Clostridium tertium TaxID=1559 RepID=UPI0023B29644|nr:hypothetical protein [Clostridium tertium]
MSCKYSRFDDSGRFNCLSSGGACAFLVPNSERCYKELGEGPDSQKERCENCWDFYYNDIGQRCCRREGHLTVIELNGAVDIITSPLINDDVISCGGFKNNI